jgi:hypothetical protein
VAVVAVEPLDPLLPVGPAVVPLELVPDEPVLELVEELVVDVIEAVVEPEFEAEVEFVPEVDEE